MRFPIIILFIVLSSTSRAAEKIPLSDFLNRIRHQLYSIENSRNNPSTPAIIRNVHIDMHVIAEKDENGNTEFYVLEGMANQKDVVTQNLSLDLELQSDASMMRNDSKRRTYSTRMKNDTSGADAYRQPGQYPCDPVPYMPDLYPVIMLDKEP